MSSLDPIAKNDVWATMAALARRVRALESVGGAAGFQTGDILASVKTHPDMLTTTLSDGGRPGWWLLNGATDPNMQTTDPDLYAYLGDSNVLKSAKGKTIAGPNGTTFVAGASPGAESQIVPAESPHVHGLGGASVVGSPGISLSSIDFDRDSPDAFGLTNATVNVGTLDVGGSTDSGGGSGGGSVSVIQPTLVVGTIWIKR